MTNAELQQLFTEHIVIFDGAMGTELYRRHVFTNRCFEELCCSEPTLVTAIHLDYLKAGADVLTTNSFGANSLSLKKFGMEGRADAINRAAVAAARKAIEEAAPTRPIHIAGSIGPAPTKDTTKAERLAAWTQQATALLEGGADFLLFETLPTVEYAQEARQVMAALPLDTPFILSRALNPDDVKDGVLAHCLASLSEGGPRPAAIGFNCGLGPDAMLSALEAARSFTTLPLVIQPNSGQPKHMDFRQLYLCSPEYFTTYALRYANLGARGIGGCCGTTPEHIADMARSLKPMSGHLITAPRTVTTATVAVPETPLAERSRLGAKLAKGEWITTIEIAPPRGCDTSRILEKAARCRQAGVDVINIPDGPRAAPRMSAMVTAMKIQQEATMETVLHVCGRDRNYIGLQADLLGCAAVGLRNLLFITGDPPKLGNYTFASGVFDADSIGLVHLQKNLNHGMDLAGQKIEPPTQAVIGVGADPNALDFDREVRRLREKAAAGADYVTTQPVFDPNALLRFLEAIQDLNLPVIAGIWPLASLRNALFMKNEVPGVVVPDSVIARMEQAESGPGQQAVGIEIAREAMAAIRPHVAGVQVSAPLGNVKIALAVLEP